ncbi:MAG: hypothetical protein WD851_16550 [Pirellulales bacterium]
MVPIRIVSLLGCSVLLVTLGCRGGDEIDRVMVSGNVSYNGQPVEKGQIRFIPTDGTQGPLTVDPIDDGYYTTENTGGVPVGTHRVEILGYDGEEYANAPTGPGAPPVRQLLPKKYNKESELKVTLQSGQDEDNLDFDLAP